MMPDLALRARLLLCFCCLLLTACSASRIPIREGTPEIQTGVVKDLRIFPQNLTVYARIDGQDMPLLSPVEQAAQDARFNRIFFGPWDMSKVGTTSKQFRGMFGKAKGYRGTAPWTQATWDAIARNADIGRYPSMRTPAITLRHTNLRELPTLEARYSKPTPDPLVHPFDYFQYSSLALGTPLFITHATRDKQWYFVENPIAAGWVRTEDVAPVDTAFANRYRNGRYAAIIRDNVTVTTERDQNLGRVHIGTILPVAAVAGDHLEVFVPVRGVNGHADIFRALLMDGDAVIKPLPALPKLMAVVGNSMMGQPYGWGGMNENRDCSSTVRDLFAPFGIWLPRNSASQARAGRFESLEGLSPETKEQTILSSGVPFMTLLWMRGHIGLYVGNYKGKAAFFHNIWGIRVDSGENGANRHVIGRCVVTSLEPGKELPHANPTGTLITRIRGMSTLPRAL